MRYKKKIETPRVFELWFEFLKLGNPEKCSSKVAELFGDVWSTNFKNWWPEHAYLFEEMEPLRMEVVSDMDDYHHIEGSDDLLIVAIPLSNTQTYLRKQFDALLREHHPSGAGMPKYEKYADHFKLACRPYIHGLEQTLKVYNYVQELKKKGINETNWKIEEELKLIDKRAKTINGEKVNRWKNASTKKEVADLRRTQAVTVSRYLSQAHFLIANAEQGVFPRNKYIDKSDFISVDE